MLKRIDAFSLWYRTLARSACAVIIALSLSGALTQHALAADDDDEDSFETKIIKGILGINDKDSIDYRERPPLVVPPNITKLPPPETAALVNSPAWPKDPEIAERKKRRDLAKTQKRRSVEEDNRALTPAELNVVGPKAGAGRVANPTGPQDAEADGRRVLRPDELGYKGGLLGSLFKDNTKPEVATFEREPTRSDLTQPPAGYRTPSPSYPYGISPKQEKAKPFDWINNVGTMN